MASRQTRLMVILVAVLLAVVLASVTILWLLPASSPTAEEPIAANSPEVGDEPGNEQSSQAEGLDLAPVQRAGWRALDTQPILEGALPVQPPAVVGKANPFL